MTKAIGPQVFVPDFGGVKTEPTYRRVSASDLNVKESWFRDAIFSNPELVLAPCRQAGLVPPDEQWLPWATEFPSGDAGPMDVLLLSSSGRVGIVETKLSYNPERRREVVAQILEYALAFQEAEDLPPWPMGQGVPHEADVREKLAHGEFLLIIAGDEMDPRAIRLGEALLAGHMTSEWDLAMIDLNVYAEQGAVQPKHLLVPELRGVLVHEARQVVRVVIKGEKPEARVELERITTPSRSKHGGATWTDERFFQAAENTATPQAVKGLRRALSFAKEAGPGTRVEWGSGADKGAFVLRCGAGTIFYCWSDGRLQVFVNMVTKSIGPDLAKRVFGDLSTLLGVIIPLDQACPAVKADLLADDTRFEQFRAWAQGLRKLLVKEEA